MRLARVIGTVTATVKQPALTGGTLLLTDVLDGAGNVVVPAVIAIDTCGAGVGDDVMLVEGSAARLPASLAGVPVDAAIIAVVDQVTLAPSVAPPAKRSSTASKRRKS